jgi:Ca2+-binding RTX toxin-like protein
MNYIGTNANDVLIGTSANDTFQGMLGADYLFGGNGNDTAIYLDSLAGVYVNLAAGTGDFGSAEGDTLVYIENVQGSVFGDLLVGDIHANILEGWGGNDTLKGGGGADTLNGGAGSDTASYDGSASGVFVSLMSNKGSGGDAQGDVLLSIENLTGSDHDDDLYGNDGGNVLRGDSGNDTLKGWGGADTLWGDANNDSLFGMDGQDILNGGSGNDVLNGGAHADVLNGGTGADEFYFYAMQDTTVAAPDQITDLNENAGDRINLSHIDANLNVDGNQAFTWIGNNNDFVESMGAGQLRCNGGYVEGDVDGDMVADFRIQVNVAELHDYAFIL